MKSDYDDSLVAGALRTQILYALCMCVCKNGDSSSFVGNTVRENGESGKAKPPHAHTPPPRPPPPIRKEKKDRTDMFRDKLDRKHKSRDTTSKDGHKDGKRRERSERDAAF